MIMVVLVLAFFTAVFSIPVMPTEEKLSGEVVGFSIVRGEVLGIEPKDSVIYVLVVKPENSKLRFRSGNSIEVRTKRVLPSWLFGKKVSLLISYRGDERGGNYWLIRVLEVR